MPDLTPQLNALLDAATSEAKRRGHDRVTAAHLAVALDAANLDAGKPDEGTQAAVTAYLAGLPRTFGTPTVDPDTMALIVSCGQRADPIVALVDELRVQSAAWARVEARPAANEPAVGEAVGATEVTTAAAPRTFTLPEPLRSAAVVVPTAPPAVPRDDVVRRLLAMITARHPQAPLVVAPEGQGRSGLAQCLAAHLAAPDYSEMLAGWPVVRVRCEGVVSAERWETLGEIFRACRGRAVVYVDDVEVLAALGVGRDDRTLAEMRGALHDPDLRVVFAVAAEFVDRLQAADAELFDELDRVDLLPLDDEQVLSVARSAAGELAAFHNVEIPVEVVAAAAAPPRQIDSKGHPALAVARLDRAAAAARFRTDRVASISDLGSAVTGQQYLSFDPDATREQLKQQIIGQDGAIDAIVDRLALTRASLDGRPERPDGVFLLAGPTGTGKTALALALAQEVFGTSDAVIRLDMSEFSESHTVSKLIGSPPGYVGSTEPESWMTTKVRKRPQSILLLDEIEKAHPLVWNTFLQVFDAGRLTDSAGRIADFRDVIVILTTNIGAEAFAATNGAGFLEVEDSAGADERQVMDAIKRTMRPELINRLDATLVFRPLTPETVRAIVRQQVEQAVRRLDDRGWTVEHGEDVLDVLQELGYSKEYGARPLLRTLEEHFLGPIGRLAPGRVTVAVKEGRIVVTPAEQ